MTEHKYAKYLRAIADGKAVQARAAALKAQMEGGAA